MRDEQHMKEDTQREAQALAVKAKARHQGLQINHITTTGPQELEDYVPRARISLNMTCTHKTRDTITHLDSSFDCNLISYETWVDLGQLPLTKSTQQL